MNLTRYRGLLFAGLIIASIGMGCSGKNNENNAQVDTGSEPDTGVDASDMPTDGIADMPRSEGFAIPTLSAPATAKYDENGILHVECETDRDCFVMEGYFHARDRFLQMDLLRNQTRGRLSTMLGFALGYESDTYWRPRMMTGDGETPLEQAYFDAASDETKEIFYAYAEGVNAWLDDVRAARNGAALPREYDSGLLYGIDEIQDWEPADSVCLYLQLGWTWSWGESLILASAQFGLVGDDDIAWDLTTAPNPVQSYMSDHEVAPNMLRSAPKIAPPIDFTNRLLPFASVIRQANARPKQESLVFGEFGRPASNSWAIGPTNTADGSTLLANDPHLDMNNPPIWYVLELRSKQGDLHVAGGSVPGAPGVISGHNAKVAWGTTVAVFGLADIYTETLNADRTAVIRDGQEVPIITKEIEFPGRFDQVRMESFDWVPGHGPIIEKDLDAGTALSIRWVAHEPGPDINFIRDLVYAESVAEADVALDPVRSINVNWVLADVEGNFAWYADTQMPERRPWASEFPRYLPIPGDGSAEWQGWVSKDEIPFLLNPAIGFIANTNNNLNDNWADGDPTNDGRPNLQIRGDSSNNVRHQRAMQLLGARTDHDLDSMLEVSSDIYSHYASLILPLLIDEVTPARAQLSPAAEAVLQRLESWDYMCPTGLDGQDPEAAALSSDASEVASSIGCSVFHVWLRASTSVLVSDEFAPTGFSTDLNWKVLERIGVNLLLKPENLRYGDRWADDLTTTDVVETRVDWLLASLELTVTRLEELFASSDPSDWVWGRQHVALLPGLLGISQYDHAPVSTPGGLYTLAKADPGREKLGHVDGQSMRLQYRLSADGVEATVALPGGNVYQPDSPYYDNLLEKWGRFERTPIPFGADDFAEISTEPLVFQSE